METTQLTTNNDNKIRRKTETIKHHTSLESKFIHFKTALEHVEDHSHEK